MADIKLSLGQVNITDYLIVRIREVASPTAIVASQVFGPAPSGVINIDFPNVNPVTHYVDFYESSDGTALTALLALYTVDARTNQLLYERRFYIVDVTPGASSTGSTITDAYLNGKSIAGFSQRAFGALIPGTEWTFSGSTITNLYGNLSANDTYWVDITYTQPINSSNANKSFFAGIATLTTNTTLDNTYYNKRIRINGGNAHVLPDAGTVPDGTMFYFITQQLSIPQSKISSISGIIQPWGILNEIWIGKGQKLWLEKVTISGTPYYEVVDGSHNIEKIGQRFAGTSTQHINVLAEDDQIYNAADYPGIWWWLHNKTDAGTVVPDASLTRPADKQGLFIVDDINNRFRMPDTRNLSERGLLNFSSFGSDTNREYDFPGGFQDEMVGPHTHPLPRDASGIQNIQSVVDTANADEGISSLSPTGTNTGTENRVKNFGVIFYRYV